MIVRKAVRLSGVDALALTKLDVLSGLETIKICTGYTLDGQPTRRIPPIADVFDRVVPVYEEHPGWDEDLSGVTSVEDLPANAAAYVRRLEELVGVSVAILSTGPGREQTVVLDEPFAD